MPRGQSPGPTLVRSNYHGPLAQAEGRLRLTHLPPCPSPLPPTPPHPNTLQSFPHLHLVVFSYSSSLFLLLLQGHDDYPGTVSPFGLWVSRRHGATGEGDGHAAEDVNNNDNNNNNSVSSLAKRCKTKRPIWVYGAQFYSRGDGVADAAQLRWKV